MKITIGVPDDVRVPTKIIFVCSSLVECILVLIGFFFRIKWVAESARAWVSSTHSIKIDERVEKFNPMRDKDKVTYRWGKKTKFVTPACPEGLWALRVKPPPAVARVELERKVNLIPWYIKIRHDTAISMLMPISSWRLKFNIMPGITHTHMYMHIWPSVSCICKYPPWTVLFEPHASNSGYLPSCFFQVSSWICSGGCVLRRVVVLLSWYHLWLHRLRENYPRTL